MSDDQEIVFMENFDIASEIIIKPYDDPLDIDEEWIKENVEITAIEFPTETCDLTLEDVLFDETDIVNNIDVVDDAIPASVERCTSKVVHQKVKRGRGRPRSKCAKPVKEIEIAKPYSPPEKRTRRKSFKLRANDDLCAPTIFDAGTSCSDSASAANSPASDPEMDLARSVKAKIDADFDLMLTQMPIPGKIIHTNLSAQCDNISLILKMNK